VCLGWEDLAVGFPVSARELFALLPGKREAGVMVGEEHRGLNEFRRTYGDPGGFSGALPKTRELMVRAFLGLFDPRQWSALEVRDPDMPWILVKREYLGNPGVSAPRFA
jgi:hypothetical protein